MKELKYYVKIKQHVRHENKANENKISSYYEAEDISKNIMKYNEKVILYCVKVTNPLSF